MASTKELKLDVAELESLLTEATRQKVKDILSIEIRKLKTEIINLEDKAKQEEAKPNADEQKSAPKPAHTQRILKELDTYGWDQSDKFMKIYVTLNGVQKIPKENITCEYTDRSFKLYVKDLDNKDYRLHVAHLYAPIIKADSYHKIKTDMVLIMMKKEEAKNTWAYVTQKEEKSKKKPEKKFDENADPQAGLMDMMKQMYEDGDDEMKRTIAKAWSQSREKQGGDQGGMMGGMPAL